MTERDLMQRPEYRDAVRSPAAYERRSDLATAIAESWPARAEFIRGQVRMRQLAMLDERRTEAYEKLVFRDYDLYRELSAMIRVPIDALGYVRDPGFRGGLVASVELDLHDFVTRGSELVGEFPITSIALGASANDIARLADCQALRQITTLGFVCPDLGDDGIRQLVASPHLSNLRRLWTSGAALTRAGYEHVIEATQTTLANLELFSSDGNAIDSPQERQPSYDSISGFPVYETVGFLPEEGDALEAKYGYQKVLHWCSRFGPELEKWPYE